MPKVKNYNDRIFFKVSKSDKEQLKKIAKMEKTTMNAIIREFIDKKINDINTRMKLFKEENQ